MIPEPTAGQLRQWVKRYKAAALELEDVHRMELRALTDEEALRRSEAVLSAAPVFRRRRRTSGLVKQQALFRRFWRK